MLQASGDATGMAAYTDLPPELLDQIFVHLHLPHGWDEGKDRGDLCACRLVNRMWADLAFRHTFAAISFTVGVPDVASADPKDSRSLRDLQDFLTESPHICEVVHTLNLISVATYQQGGLWASVLYSIVTLLPKVQRILLSGMLQRLDGNILHGQKARRSIQCLQLSMGPSGYGAELDELRCVTDMFLDIDELVFKRFWLVTSDTDPTPIPPTCVRRIHYDRTWTDLHTFLGLTQNLDTQWLHSLTIFSRPLAALPESWPTFRGVLQKISLQLTQLGLHVSGWSGDDRCGHRYFVACSGAVLTLY